MNSYFTFECRDYVATVQIRSVLLLLTQAKYTPTAFTSKGKYEKLAIVVRVLYVEFSHFTLLFAEDGQEMYQEQ